MRVTPVFKVGDRDEKLVTISKRIGFFPATDEFTPSMAALVRGIQMGHGWPVTGDIDTRVLEYLGLAEWNDTILGLTL